MTTINYHPDHLSGCCDWLRRRLETDKSLRLYDIGNTFKIEIMPFFADFPFTWHCSLGFLLFNYRTEWPIQMLLVNGEFDHNSFISLN